MNITREQYHQRVLDFHRANRDMAFMVHGKPQPGGDWQREDAARKAWFAYLTINGLTGTLNTFRHLLNEGKAVMFPTEKPEWFDPSYVAPVHGYRDPTEPGQQARGDVSRVVQETLASLRAARPKGRQPVPPAHLREPTKTPKEWLDEYQANPPPIQVLSDEARSKFGLPPPDEAAA